MVAAVAQKTVWKMRKAMTGYPASSPTVNFVTKKSGVPVLHDDITGVFSPGQACLAHGKARLHKKDQRGSQQHPDGVRGRITLG